MITIYGASDDLVEVDGCPGADEFNVYRTDGAIMWHGDFVASGTHASEQMRVYAIFDSCWHFSVGQVHEDLPVPDWGNIIQQAPDCAYSAILSIEAPEGTRLTNIWPEQVTV